MSTISCRLRTESKTLSSKTVVNSCSISVSRTTMLSESRCRSSLSPCENLNFLMSTSSELQSRFRILVSIQDFSRQAGSCKCSEKLGMRASRAARLNRYLLCFIMSPLLIFCSSRSFSALFMNANLYNDVACRLIINSLQTQHAYHHCPHITSRIASAPSHPIYCGWLLLLPSTGAVQIVVGTAKGQQKQMFDYNKQQKFLEQAFRPRKLYTQQTQREDIKAQQQKRSVKTEQKTTGELTCDPEFIKVKINPFLEIEEPRADNKFIRDLDFSIIELKSPTSSESYNSLRGENFFGNIQKQLARSPAMEEQPLFLKTRQDIRSFNQAARKLEEESKVPTFFIKMPRHFQEERKQEKITHRKKAERDIDRQLEDIYKGKYKISRSPSRL